MASFNALLESRTEGRFYVYDLLTIFAGFIFVFSAIAGGLARTPISGPIVFCAFGWLIADSCHFEKSACPLFRYSEELSGARWTRS